MKRIAAGVMLASGSVATLLAQRPPVPLVLHHLEIVVDSATFRDIHTSPFITSQFAAVDSTGSGRAGIVLVGKYNYVVIAPQPAIADALTTRIVLSSETPGGLRMLGTTLGMAVHEAEATGSRRESRAYQGSEAWVITPPISDVTGLTIMEYSDVESRALGVRDSVDAGNLRNARFLAPYFDATRAFSHLTAATLALPVADIARIVEIVQKDGVVVHREGEGALIMLDAFTLHLIPPFRGAGVKQLQFALTGDVTANPTYRFGPRSRLRFGPGSLAVWDFDPHD